MKTIRLLPLAVAAVSLAASAQSARPLPAVADPAAPVAHLIYQSVFSDSEKRMEDQPTPDQLWVDANRQVTGSAAAGLTGHTGHVMASPAPAGAARPVAPKEAKPPTNKHDGHHAPAKEK